MGLWSDKCQPALRLVWVFLLNSRWAHSLSNRFIFTHAKEVMLLLLLVCLHVSLSAGFGKNYPADFNWTFCVDKVWTKGTHSIFELMHLTLRKDAFFLHLLPRGGLCPPSAHETGNFLCRCNAAMFTACCMLQCFWMHMHVAMSCNMHVMVSVVELH